MAKGDKVKTFDDSPDDDDDLPSYDELASLVKEQNKMLEKLSTKLEKAKSENKSLKSKCNEIFASYDHGKVDEMAKKIASLEEANKKLISSNKELEMDKGYNMIKKSHIEQAQEIKELNETLDEVNKCYRELAITHEDLCERRILQLHSIELDEARKGLEAKLHELNSIHKIDESPNDIKDCEKTCVPKSKHEELVIEFEKLKIKMSQSPNVLNDVKPCTQCKNKSSSEKDASILIKLKDDIERLELEKKSLQSGYASLLQGSTKINEILSTKVQFEKHGLGYPPIKDTCKAPPSIVLEKPKWARNA